MCFFFFFYSKSCGQSLSNEDRISQLPEALLLQILSLLPTEVVVATSVLSKRWRSLWKLLPNLKFVYNDRIDFQTFSDYVCRSLLSHQAPVLQSLHLRVCDEGNIMDLGVLVGIAFGLHVRRLKLQVYCDEGSFTFPRSLYNCETLETLELGTSCGSSILVDVPSPVCLKSLRTLHLDQVGYEDDKSVFNLLSGCSNLENLVVNRNGFDDVKTFIIAVSSLQRLTIIDEYDESDKSVYVINAPLKYLKIESSNNLGSCLIENAPELMEANINMNGVISENILGSITSVKRLFLKISPLEITFPTGSIFYQLACLEICTCKSDWWNLLTLMLDSSPSLQVLKLKGFSSKWDKFKDVAWGKWIQPKNVPECLLLHLETFVLSVWTCYKGKLEDEKEVAKYILRNARHLKKATFSKININSEERVKMVKELENVVRASNSCQLVFE